MKINQISIFLENTAGRLAEIAEVLGNNNINIRALSLADTAEFGILRLIVNDVEKAYEILKKNNYTVSITQVIAVEVEDKPGGLANVLKEFAKYKVNIEYMYAFVEKNKGNAVLIFRIENIKEAIEILKNANVKLLSNEEILKL